MDVRKHKKYMYVRGIRIGSKDELKRMSIIFCFIFISAVVSVLMPIYFSLAALKDMTP